MREFATLLVVTFFSCHLAVAQDAAKQDADVPHVVDPPLRSYVVQLTEFRMASSSDPKVTANDIVKAFEQMTADGKVEITETVRVTTLENFQSMAQFGRRATVTVGVMNPGPGRPQSRSTQQVMIGTMVEVSAVAEAGKTRLELSYEASRFDGQGKEDSPPDTITFQVKTTLLLEAGKPTLVSGTSGDTTSYLMVSIQ